MRIRHFALSCPPSPEYQYLNFASSPPGFPRGPSYFDTQSPPLFFSSDVMACFCLLWEHFETTFSSLPALRVFGSSFRHSLPVLTADPLTFLLPTQRRLCCSTFVFFLDLCLCDSLFLSPLLLFFFILRPPPAVATVSCRWTAPAFLSPSIFWFQLEPSDSTRFSPGLAVPPRGPLPCQSSHFLPPPPFFAFCCVGVFFFFDSPLPLGASCFYHPPVSRRPLPPLEVGLPSGLAFSPFRVQHRTLFCHALSAKFSLKRRFKVERLWSRSAPKVSPFGSLFLPLQLVTPSCGGSSVELPSCAFHSDPLTTSSQ